MLDAANIFLSLGANAILSLFITIFVHNNQLQSFFLNLWNNHSIQNLY